MQLAGGTDSLRGTDTEGAGLTSCCPACLKDSVLVDKPGVAQGIVPMLVARKGRRFQGWEHFDSMHTGVVTLDALEGQCSGFSGAGSGSCLAYIDVAYSSARDVAQCKSLG